MRSPPLPVASRWDLKPCFYPVPWSDAIVLAEEAGLAHLTSRGIEEVMRASDRIARAASAAAHYQLRNPRFSREPERLAACAVIEAAHGQITETGDPALQRLLTEALSAVESGLDDAQGEDLAQSQATVSNAWQAMIAKLNEALAGATLAAAVQELASGSNRPDAREP